jgi:lycopene cyclase domain-containing protein
MPLYLWLDLAAVAVPFVLSFEKNLRYYKKWSTLFAATFLMMIPFLVWDSLFTQNGIWGFNSAYLLGIKFFELPLEEILFFIIVPYSSLFAFYAIRFHFPKYVVNQRIGRWISFVLIFSAILLAALNTGRLYTVINFSFFALVLIITYKTSRILLFQFYAVFPILMIPFFIMNGILTGTGIVDEIVWYNPNAFMGLRLGTIPIEDLFYAFSMLMMVLALKEGLEKLSRRS